MLSCRPQVHVDGVASAVVDRPGRQVGLGHAERLLNCPWIAVGDLVAVHRRRVDVDDVPRHGHMQRDWVPGHDQHGRRVVGACAAIDRVPPPVTYRSPAASEEFLPDDYDNRTRRASHVPQKGGKLGTARRGGYEI